MNKMTIRPLAALISLLSVGAGIVRAQSASGTGPVSTTKEAEDDTVVLSPFVVTAEEDSGYLATATLAGSRVRTDVKDLASSLSIVTKQFLNDIGAVNNTSLLTYTTNTEVGGLYGNYAGIGSPYINGAGETATNLLRPQTNTRVRGLDSADNTRDFFATDIPWDGFNIGRVDMQRGPNSILFGVGSPAGIINTSVNTAGFKTEGNVQNRIGSFGSVRDSIDLNYVLLPKQLSVRLAGVVDDAKYRQKPAYNHDRRLFGALRWDPKLFSEDIHTSVRASYEKGKVTANRPRGLPPIDRLTPFFDKDKINKQFFDPSIADATGQLPYRTTLGAPTNYWIGGGRGIGEWYNPVLYYNNTGSPVDARQGRPTSEFAIKPDGSSGGGIAWGNGTFPIGISGYNAYAVALDQYGPANGRPADELARVAGASAGFYKDKQITDPNIFDFYRILLDGNTKKEWQGWEAYNISFDQTFFNDRLGYQAVYDRQTYYDGNVSNLGWSPSLAIDIMQNNIMYPGQIPELAVPNPNAGRVYTSGSGRGSDRFTFREAFRFTAFGELRAKDYLPNGLLSSILGHHTITGLYSTEKYQVEDRAWDRYSITPVWANLLGFNNTNHPGSGVGALDQITYLSNSVVGFASASQLHVQGIAGEQTVPQTLSASYFDSHWNKPKNPSDPGYVDPAAVWMNPVGTTPSESTQSQNPANYVGWKYASVPILSADRGDLNDLYRSGSKNQKKTISKGATWQAYLWDDTIVATVGWRTDTVRQRAGYPDPAITQRTGIAPMMYDLAPQQANGVATGDNVSWGVVVHTPKKIRQQLPWGTDISLGFNNSNNIRVENRYGFDGDVLPNAKGHSRDISLVISTLNDRLTFKVAHYKTTVKDANISSVTSEASTLGNNTYILRQVEAQGTGSAMMDLAGIQGHFPGWEWYWNWAEIAGEPGTGDHAWDNDYWNPVGSPEAQARFFAHPETIKELAAIKAWQDTMQPQSFFDALGYDIDVAKVKAGDWAHAINHGEWQPASYLGSIGTAGAGRINGVYPTGTVDNESKGWEFELTGRPLKNWDISLNASKQFASQTALGKRFSDFIERLHTKFEGPAGDLRVWWGGDNTFRQMFNQNIWAAYQFQQQTNGKLVGEMAPWRFNMVNNYHFTEGLLKGANAGFGYRWQDGTIQGYGLNAKKDNLDINKPYWSKSESYLDLWAGYERKVTAKINWRIQLNLGSVGTKPRLIPYNVQPDGSPAQYRIQEGMTYSLTNTLSF